jgi:hypothetical protein
MFDPTSEEPVLHEIQNIGLDFIGFYNILFKMHDILLFLLEVFCCLG